MLLNVGLLLSLVLLLICFIDVAVCVCCGSVIVAAAVVAGVVIAPLALRYYWPRSTKSPMKM